MKLSLPKKSLVMLLCVVIPTQTVLASLSESNVWKERRELIEKEKSDARPTQLASLPNSINPQSIFKKLPSIAGGLPLEKKWSTNKKSKTLGLSKNFETLLDSIPLGYASIQDVYDSQDEKVRPVILLQDVHLNPEAQNNIAAVLQELFDHKQVGLVGVEGAFNPFDFTRFRAFSDKKITKEVADAFINKNIIAAPTYVGITSVSEPPRFIGIDDLEHYKENVKAYLTTIDLKEKSKIDVEKLRIQIQDKKKSIFSPELRAFDDLRVAYHQGDIGFGAYVKKINSLFLPLSYKGEARWGKSVHPVLAPPNLPTVRRGEELTDNKNKLGLDKDFFIEQFLEAYDMESTLDFKKVDEERQRVIEKLTKVMKEKELSALLAQSLAYRTGKIGFGNYYQNLKNLCDAKGINLGKTPAFENYIRYVLLSDGIKADALFKSVNKLEENLLTVLAKTPEEKELANLSEYISLAEKLIEFSLTPTEWEKYYSRRGVHRGGRQNAGRHDVDETKSDSSGGNVLLGEPPARPYGSLKSDQPDRPGSDTPLQSNLPPLFQLPNLSPFEKFYVEADIRSQKMVENILSHSTPGNRVLTVGGFHTPQISQLLREQKISYVVVSPKITKVDGKSSSSYLSIFAREKSSLDQLFKGEKLFLAPATVNAVGAGAREGMFRFIATQAARNQQKHGTPGDVGISVKNDGNKLHVTSSDQELENLDIIIDPTKEMGDSSLQKKANLNGSVLNSLVIWLKNDALGSLRVPGAFGFWNRVKLLRNVSLTQIGFLEGGLTAFTAYIISSQMPLAPPSLQMYSLYVAVSTIVMMVMFFQIAFQLHKRFGVLSPGQKSSVVKDPLSISAATKSFSFGFFGLPFVVAGALSHSSLAAGFLIVGGGFISALSHALRNRGSDQRIVSKKKSPKISTLNRRGFLEMLTTAAFGVATVGASLESKVHSSRVEFVSEGLNPLPLFIVYVMHIGKNIDFLKPFLNRAHRRAKKQGGDIPLILLLEATRSKMIERIIQTLQGDPLDDINAIHFTMNNLTIIQNEYRNNPFYRTRVDAIRSQILNRDLDIFPLHQIQLQLFTVGPQRSFLESLANEAKSLGGKTFATYERGNFEVDVLNSMAFEVHLAVTQALAAGNLGEAQKFILDWLKLNDDQQRLRDVLLREQIKFINTQHPSATLFHARGVYHQINHEDVYSGRPAAGTQFFDKDDIRVQLFNPRFLEKASEVERAKLVFLLLISSTLGSFLWEEDVDHELPMLNQLYRQMASLKTVDEVQTWTQQFITNVQNNTQRVQGGLFRAFLKEFYNRKMISKEVLDRALDRLGPAAHLDAQGKPLALKTGSQGDTERPKPPANTIVSYYTNKPFYALLGMAGEIALILSSMMWGTPLMTYSLIGIIFSLHFVGWKYASDQGRAPPRWQAIVSHTTIFLSYALAYHYSDQFTFSFLIPLSLQILGDLIFILNSVPLRIDDKVTSPEQPLQLGQLVFALNILTQNPTPESISQINLLIEKSDEFSNAKTAIIFLNVVVGLYVKPNGIFIPTVLNAGRQLVKLHQQHPDLFKNESIRSISKFLHFISVQNLPGIEEAKSLLEQLESGKNNDHQLLTLIPNGFELVNQRLDEIEKLPSEQRFAALEDAFFPSSLSRAHPSEIKKIIPDDYLPGIQLISEVNDINQTTNWSDRAFRRMLQSLIDQRIISANKTEALFTQAQSILVRLESFKIGDKKILSDTYTSSTRTMMVSFVLQRILFGLNAEVFDIDAKRGVELNSFALDVLKHLTKQGQLLSKEELQTAMINAQILKPKKLIHEQWGTQVNSISEELRSEMIHNQYAINATQSFYNKFVTSQKPQHLALVLDDNGEMVFTLAWAQRLMIENKNLKITLIAHQPPAIVDATVKNILMVLIDSYFEPLRNFQSTSRLEIVKEGLVGPGINPRRDPNAVIQAFLKADAIVGQGQSFIETANGLLKDVWAFSTVGFDTFASVVGIPSNEKLKPQSLLIFCHIPAATKYFDSSGSNRDALWNGHSWNVRSKTMFEVLRHAPAENIFSPELLSITFLDSDPSPTSKGNKVRPKSPANTILGYFTDNKVSALLGMAGEIAIILSSMMWGTPLMTYSLIGIIFSMHFVGWKHASEQGRAPPLWQAILSHTFIFSSYAFAYHYSDQFHFLYFIPMTLQIFGDFIFILKQQSLKFGSSPDSGHIVEHPIPMSKIQRIKIPATEDQKARYQYLAERALKTVPITPNPASLHFSAAMNQIREILNSDLDSEKINLAVRNPTEWKIFWLELFGANLTNDFENILNYIFDVAAIGKSAEQLQSVGILIDIRQVFNELDHLHFPAGSFEKLKTRIRREKALGNPLTNNLSSELPHQIGIPFRSALEEIIISLSEKEPVGEKFIQTLTETYQLNNGEREALQFIISEDFDKDTVELKARANRDKAEVMKPRLETHPGTPETPMSEGYAGVLIRLNSYLEQNLPPSRNKKKLIDQLVASIWIGNSPHYAIETEAAEKIMMAAIKVILRIKLQPQDYYEMHQLRTFVFYAGGASIRAKRDGNYARTISNIEFLLTQISDKKQLSNLENFFSKLDSSRNEFSRNILEILNQTEASRFRVNKKQFDQVEAGYEEQTEEFTTYVKAPTNEQESYISIQYPHWRLPDGQPFTAMLRFSRQNDQIIIHEIQVSYTAGEVQEFNFSHKAPRKWAGQLMDALLEWSKQNNLQTIVMSVPITQFQKWRKIPTNSLYHIYTSLPSSRGFTLESKDLNLSSSDQLIPVYSQNLVWKLDLKNGGRNQLTQNKVETEILPPSSALKVNDIIDSVQKGNLAQAVLLTSPSATSLGVGDFGQIKLSEANEKKDFSQPNFQKSMGYVLGSLFYSSRIRIQKDVTFGFFDQTQPDLKRITVALAKAAGERRLVRLIVPEVHLESYKKIMRSISRLHPKLKIEYKTFSYDDDFFSHLASAEGKTNMDSLNNRFGEVINQSFFIYSGLTLEGVHQNAIPLDEFLPPIELLLNDDRILHILKAIQTAA